MIAFIILRPLAASQSAFLKGGRDSGGGWNCANEVDVCVSSILAYGRGRDLKLHTYIKIMNQRFSEMLGEI
jgi:hypothetical protein